MQCLNGVANLEQVSTELLFRDGKQGAQPAP